MAALHGSKRLAGATPRDAESFCALSNSLYARPVDPRYYDWQFFQTPFQSLLAVREDITPPWTACYGFQLRPLAGEQRTVAWAIDIMVEQSQQRRGIFSDLAEFAAAEASRFQPVALAVMANVKADAAHASRLHWTRVQTFMTYFAASAPHRARLEYAAIRDFAECDALFDADRRFAAYATRRTAALLNWRFRANPRYNYDAFAVRREGALFGYIVLKHFRDPASGSVFGDIVDVFWLDDDRAAVEDMLRFALNEFHLAGIGRVAAWLQTNTILDEIGTAVGFERSEQPRYFLLQILDPSYRAMERSENWFLTMADAEVY